MAANPETLAMFGGKPLLGREGMEEIHGLLRAHVEYDEAEGMHQSEITDLDEQIQALETEREELVAEREKAVSVQHAARHTHASRLINAAEKSYKGGNPVYTTVLRSVASDSQGGFWYPSTLEHADTIGRSLVALDASLRRSTRKQPALLIERERGGYINIYSAETRRRRGLAPTKVPMQERRGYTDYTVERDALALPVTKRSIVGLQVHPNTFGDTKTVRDSFYYRGPDLRDELTDSFKLLLPQGTIFGEPTAAGTYDEGEETADILLSPGRSLQPNRLQVAIGRISVRTALDNLRGEFSEQSGDPGDAAWTELEDIALRKTTLHQPPEPERRRIRSNFTHA